MRVLESAQSDDYIVSTGKARSVREFAEAASAAAGLGSGVRYLRGDPVLTQVADGAVQIRDANRIRERLGWNPT